MPQAEQVRCVNETMHLRKCNAKFVRSTMAMLMLICTSLHGMAYTQDCVTQLKVMWRPYTD